VAGGPTSVLIVNYGQSRASGALTGSTAYENLSRALDAMSEPKGETRSRDDFMSSEIRLTWMIHDVSPWRVDALFLDGKDVWVSTTMSYDGASLFDKPAVWHRPADARLLLATLTSLGVIGALPASATTPQADATAAAAPPARQLAMATPAATVPATGWPWWPAVVAVVAALGLGFAAGRAAGRSSSAGRPGRNDEPLPRRA
jgi:hypothetical protein